MGGAEVTFSMGHRQSLLHAHDCLSEAGEESLPTFGKGVHDMDGYANLDQPLKDLGLVLVTGENGAGKTSLFKALTWTLFEDTLCKQRGDEVVRIDATTRQPVLGKTRGIVELEVDGKQGKRSQGGDWLVFRPTSGRKMCLSPSDPRGTVPFSRPSPRKSGQSP
jgi:hypothetical protein